MITKRKAFTLLELSIVLVIISVIMGGAMIIFNRSLEQRQLEETQMKMAVIQKTLLDYRRAFQRIPCPADITRNMDATSSNYYGVEAANKGSCTGGTPAANFSLSSSSVTGDTTLDSAVITNVSSTTGLVVGTVVSGTGIPTGNTIKSIDGATQITLDIPATATNTTVTITHNTIVGGMVPVKVLALPDDYAIDGWGNRLMYIVDVNLTVDGAFVSTPINDSSTSRISVSGITFTGTTVSGSATITDIASTANLQVGSQLAHENIPAGATIASIDSASQITINANATISGSASIGVAKTGNAVYALLSSGKNLHGAYPRGGGATRTSNYISNDIDELTNCKCTATATNSAFERNLVQKPTVTNGFDDVVVFATRADMLGGNE